MMMYAVDLHFTTRKCIMYIQQNSSSKTIILKRKICINARIISHYTLPIIFLRKYLYFINNYFHP